MNVELEQLTDMSRYTREVTPKDFVPGQFYKVVYPAETEQPPEVIRYVSPTTPSSVTNMSPFGLIESDPLVEFYIPLQRNRSDLPKVYREPTNDSVRDIYHLRSFTRNVRIEDLTPGKLYYDGGEFIIPLPETGDKSKLEYLLVINNSLSGPPGIKYYAEGAMKKREHAVAAWAATRFPNVAAALGGAGTSVGGYRRRRKQTRRQLSRRHRKTRHLKRRSA